VPVPRLRVADWSLRRHVDRLVPYLALALRRTNFDAQAAFGAILGRDLQRITHRLEAAPSWRRRLERRGRIAELTGLVNLRANHRMWAYQHAFPALDAQVLIPDRNLLRHIALLPFRRRRGKGAVGRQSAGRQRIAVARDESAEHIANERRRVRRHRR